MDIISHGLWGGITFGRRKKFWLAFLFGLLPDLIAFLPFFAYTRLKGIYFQGAPPLEIIPPWVFNLYDLSHSLLLFALIFMAIRVLNRRIASFSLAWFLHILVDIPTHSAEYFPTKFVYPVSEVFFNGWPWTSPAIWYSNIVLLLLLYSWLASKAFFRKRYQQKQYIDLEKIS